jgi:hypothetical protein
LSVTCPSRGFLDRRDGSCAAAATAATTEEAATRAPFRGQLKEQLAAHLLRIEGSGRITGAPAEHYLERPEGRDGARCDRGDEVPSAMQRLSIHRDGGPRVEGSPNHRNILKERSVIASGLKAKPLQLAGDVCGGHQVPTSARLAPHHRIIGEDVETRHEIARRNRRRRWLGRVFER